MINPVYEAIFNYAARIGARDIRDAKGPWVYRINDEWEIAINPHNYAFVAMSKYGANSAYMHPMHCAVWRNQKYVADVSPFDCFHVDPAFDRAEFIGMLNGVLF
jgi:hypothetical protein